RGSGEWIWDCNLGLLEIFLGQRLSTYEINRLHAGRMLRETFPGLLGLLDIFGLSVFLRFQFMTSAFI
ncbi:hypothetical protein Dimus_031679, partial [Dionaea muscipula]